jgi:gliding motility-associated-like protein
MRATITYVIVLLFLFSTNNVFGQLTINTANSGPSIVTNTLLGPGVYAKNITYAGANNGKGTFNCTGGCTLGLSSGIVLASGSVFNMIGPNNSAGQTTNFGTAGDANLSGLSGTITNDAAVLEFDFIVATDSVEFKFIFGSEEYPEFVGSFNDVFGFFLTGPGIVGTKNIALIPNTTTPVTINNVNNGTTGSNGPCANCAYYVNNNVSVTLQYDGLTTVLTARAAVRPCDFYHIKLAVADANDYVLDSGVFLEANSFQALGQIPIYNNSTEVFTPDTLRICPGDSVQLCMPPCHNYAWSNGDTTQCIWVKAPGTFFGNTSNYDPPGTPVCYSFTAPIHVGWNDTQTSITAAGPLTFCAGDSVLITSDPGNSYLWSNGATTQSIYATTAGDYSVSVTYSNNCFAQSDTLTVATQGIAANITASGATTICQGDSVTLTADPAASYLWSTGATTQSIVVKASNTYTVTVSSGLCSDDKSINVIVNPKPTPVITGPASACIGSTATLNAGLFNQYLWSTGQTTQTIVVSNTNSYTVTVTNANGCTGSSQATFTSLPFTPPVITGNIGFCQNDSTILSITSPASYSNLLWSNGSSAAQTVIYNPGTVYINATASNGCQGSDTIFITEFQLPIPILSGVTSVCVNDTSVLSVTPSGLSYLWSTGSINDSVNVFQSAVYVVTVTDANNCKSSATIPFTVNPTPALTVTGTNVICDYDSTTLVASSPAANVLWNTGQSSSQITVNNSGWYSVVVTDANGCINTDSLNVTVNAAPLISITGISAFCQGDSTQLNATAGLSSYLWNNGAITSSIYTSTAGNFVVTVTDNNGCSSSTSTLIAVNPLPTPVLANTYAICEIDSIELSPGNFSSYSWSTGATTNSIYASNAGTYTVTVSDNNNCISSTSTTVTESPSPTPTILGPTEFCEASNFQLEVDATYTNYTWNNGVNVRTQTLSAAGQYSVIVVDANGCLGYDTATVAMNPLPDTNISGLPGVCEGLSSSLSAIAGQGTYLWSTGEIAESITVNATGNYIVEITTPKGCKDATNFYFTSYPIPTINYTTTQSISCQEIEISFENTSIYEPGSRLTWDFGDSTRSNAEQPKHSYALPNDYMTYLTILSPYGCSNSDSQLVSVTVPPLPLADFTPSAKVVSLFNSEIKFDNLSQFADRYIWGFGDGQASDEVSPTHIYEKIGVKKVKLTAFNGSSCIDEKEIEVNIVPQFIPNAFTPNADGKNDVFFDGVSVMNIQSFDMDIFSRWGQSIYTTDDYKRPWDGFLPNGAEAPVGVYFYFIKVTTLGGIEYELKGTVSLVR